MRYTQIYRGYGTVKANLKELAGGADLSRYLLYPFHELNCFGNLFFYQRILNTYMCIYKYISFTSDITLFSCREKKKDIL